MTQTATIVSDRPANERIASLDVIRGVAVLGILLMNVVSFGLGTSAYFNIDAGGSDSSVDRGVGVLGEVFADQKFMAVFSLLFGAGIVLFHERAVAKGRNGVALSLWRNLLLLGIGLVHSALWDGDVLFVYALCAPAVIAARRLGDRTLIGLGVGAVMLSPLLALVAQASVGDGGAGLGEYWGVAGDINDEVGIWLLTDFFVRALGLMLIGIVLYRRGFLAGRLDRSLYRRTLLAGGAIGIVVAAAGQVWLAAADFDPDVAVVASIPNTIGTIPAGLAIVSVILLMIDRLGSMQARFAAVGRMALTNYLAQTVVGLVLFEVFLDVVPGRLALLGVVAAVWAAQLYWSSWWLARYRYGPVEWAWRAATYRTLPPIRR
ncbi:MAG: DUF418 domain-containing protein [Actinomycetota bacterium]